MPFWHRRPGVPEQLRESVLGRLERGERMLAWANASVGPIAATDFGFWHDPGGGYRRLPWEEIDRAGWDDGLLRVVPSGRPTLAFRVSEPDDLPAVVRDRVTASIAVNSYASLGPSGGVRVLGRRRFSDGELVWSLAFDPGVDQDDPVVRLRAEELLDGARESIGRS